MCKEEVEVVGNYEALSNDPGWYEADLNRVPSEEWLKNWNAIKGITENDVSRPSGVKFNGSKVNFKTTTTKAAKAFKTVKRWIAETN